MEATTDSYFAPRPFRLTPSVGALPQRTRVGSGTRLGSLQSWLHRHEAGWRPDIARREEARGVRKPEQPIAAVEYEYRCAEYEYEYDGGGNPLRCLAVIRTQSASADGTRTRTRCSLLFRFLDDDQRRNHDGRFLAIRYCRVLRYANRSATSWGDLSSSKPIGIRDSVEYAFSVMVSWLIRKIDPSAA